MRLPLSAVYLPLGLMLAGCAITVDVPTNRFDSPETTGKRWRAKVEGGYGGANSVVLTPDATITPPNTQSPSFDTTQFVRLGGGVGILENLDVEVRTLTELFVKYQLLGAPRLTAEAGNFSLAVTASAGVTGESSRTSTPLFASPYKSVTTQQSETFFDAACIVGIRPDKWVLFYSGPFIRETHFSGRWMPTDQSGVVSTTAFAGDVLTTGMNIGVEVGSPLFQVKAEVAYANAKSGNLNTGRLLAGAALGFQFGQH